MRLAAGQVAVVTGGASGIGFALASRFAALGMRVVIGDLEQPAAELDATFVRMDVSKPADYERLVEAAGVPDVLCLNAGVANKPDTMWERSLADWEWLLDVNFWGVLHGIRAFVPAMIARGGEGHIVVTASLAGLITMPYNADYQASKYAAISMAESLVLELEGAKSKLKVSALCPAFVRTRIFESDRNRVDAHAVRPEFEKTFEAYRKLCAETGMAPEALAEHVMRAIEDERFYVLTHPEGTPFIEERMRHLLEGKNPRLHSGDTLDLLSDRD
jgi:NAD(P)-dependent dehydrogenase (short-subunit alcohol dehydrogenase family)